MIRLHKYGIRFSYKGENYIALYPWLWDEWQTKFFLDKTDGTYASQLLRISWKRYQRGNSISPPYKNLNHFKLTPAKKARIDKMPLVHLRYWMKHAPIGDKWMTGETGKYWITRLTELERLHEHS